jgi:hypothetical protein
VQRATKLRLLDFLVPFLSAIGLVSKTVYGVTLGWWLDPWLQRRANLALLDDVRAHFNFIVADGKIAKPKRTTVLPFDYASVAIIHKNVVFGFTRGRGDVSVSVAPCCALNDSYEIGRAIACIDGERLSEHYLVNDFESAAKLLRPRMEALNSAFSEQNYADIRQRI